ncbi:acyl-CoA dehydratase activase-related protein [Parvivirga hydrogeniphila]|uniref:acyl-CoA dehydratase activase-related protein n=1 Tax=Parvivirga hydrogeniphila TaxID=2939460 RepID=UPI00389B27D9
MPITGLSVRISGVPKLSSATLAPSTAVHGRTECSHSQTSLDDSAKSLAPFFPSHAIRGLHRSAFFEGIESEVVVSPPNTTALLERGTALSVDETCLSMKLFLGHVEALRGRCDHVLVPDLVAPRRVPGDVGRYDVGRNRCLPIAQHHLALWQDDEIDVVAPLQPRVEAAKPLFEIG